MPDERRRHVRKQVELRVRYQIGDGGRVDAQLSDLSLGGAYIADIEPPTFGTKLTLYLALPDGPELSIPAVVRWEKPQGVGIQFGNVGAKATYLLTEYLRDCEVIAS